MKLFLLSFTLLITSLSLAQTSLPDITLKNLDGQEIDLAKISEDKTVVVSLWATWCIPCIRELDTIAEEYVDLQEDYDFELIAISVDDARSTRRVKPAVLGKGWEYDVLLDVNNEIRRHLGVATIPLSLILKDGEIKFRHSSYTPGAEDQLYEKFKEIASE